MANNYRYRKNKKPRTEDNYQPPFSEEVLNQGVETLNLRDETKTLLVDAHITTVRDVVKREEKEFYRIIRFNKKNLYDIKDRLRDKGLSLKPNSEPVNKPSAPQNNDRAPKAKTDRPPVNNNTGNNPRKNNRSTNNSDSSAATREKQPLMAPVYEVVPERPSRPAPVVPEKEVPDIYVKVNKAGKWGFKDRQGKQTVAPIYDEVYNYHEDLCCVEKEERCGFINRQGEEVIPIVYDCATSFSEGLACVFKREKCGYINKNNETVIDFAFDAGTPMINGECRVKRDGKWGELHIADKTNIRWIP